MAKPTSTKARNERIYISTRHGALPSHKTTTVYIKGPSGEECYLHLLRENLVQVDAAVNVRRNCVK